MATLLASAPPSHAPLPQPGQVVAKRYELVSLIGRGGHGQIFSARHLGTGQTVALKILLPPADADEDFAIKRFFLEARATSGLSHPNTVRVFDFGQEDSGLVYLALELLTGQTLRQALRHRKNEGRVFTEREAIELALPITRSLAEAHAAKIVHRDLKPDNVFLHQVVGDEPVVKVLDFGIAKLGSNTLSTPTSVPGTPAYMSPEQVLGGDVDGRSDLYSLGVILFQLVTGELPFRGPSDPETLYMHAYQAPPDVRALAKTPLSDAFVRVIRRALEKDPTRRFADARELREALEVARDGARAAEPGGDATELVLPPRDTRPRDTRPRDGRHADVRPMTPALADDPTLTPLTTAKVPVRARAGAPSRGSVALIGAGAALALVLGGGWAAQTWLARAPTTEALPIGAPLVDAGAERSDDRAPTAGALGDEARPGAAIGVAAEDAGGIAGAGAEGATHGAGAAERGGAAEARAIASADAGAVASVDAGAADAGKVQRARASKAARPARTSDEDDILHKRLEDLVKP